EIGNVAAERGVDNRKPPAVLNQVFGGIVDAASIIARLVAAEQAVVQLYLAQVGVKNAAAVEQRRVAAQEAVIDAQKAPVGDGATPCVGPIERAAPEVPVELAAVDGHAPA